MTKHKANPRSRRFCEIPAAQCSLLTIDQSSRKATGKMSPFSLGVTRFIHGGLWSTNRTTTKRTARTKKPFIEKFLMVSRISLPSAESGGYHSENDTR